MHDGDSPGAQSAKELPRGADHPAAALRRKRQGRDAGVEMAAMHVDGHRGGRPRIDADHRESSA